MRQRMLGAWLFAGFFLSACNGNSGTGYSVNADTSNSKPSAVQPGTASGNNDSATGHLAPADTTDANFLKKAAMGGMLEITLGNLAQQNGVSPRVKFFGEMMIKDHTDANDKLSKLSKQVAVTLPDSSATQQDHHKTTLATKKGASFDKAYMKMMVEDHQEDIADFQKAANGTNQTIKAFAAQVLPVLTKHLDSAKAILSSLR